MCIVQTEQKVKENITNLNVHSAQNKQDIIQRYNLASETGRCVRKSV